MAAVQQRLQAHAKTRPGAAAPSTSRPLLHQPSEARSAINTPTAPPLLLFLTNLRLLDLDLLPDWPEISVQTFATGTSAQGQKRRIQSVEWVLFQLFSRWDPEETAKKLKPFYPPLDQVQSINLRAALLRALEQAKKNGVLGRDAVLRKTMLDECKGERLEELLAAFSAAVLKKVVSDEAISSRQHPAIALSLSIENKGFTDDKTDLSTLIIAHKVDLRSICGRRAEDAARFRDFADLLGVKERGIARKQEEAKHRETNGTGKSVSEDAKHEMRRVVRNNWSGNERWMETLLQNDANPGRDGPFGMPFERVWRRVEQDRLGELEAQDMGLLEQLDGRVRMHRERLDKWQKYRRNMFGEGTAEASPSKARSKPRGRGINLGFDSHEDIRLGNVSPKKGSRDLQPRLTGEYRDMLDSLQKELAEADDKPNPLAFLQTKRHPRRSSGTERVSEISEISDLEEESHEVSEPEPPLAPVPFKANQMGGRTLRTKLSRPNLSEDPMKSSQWPSPVRNAMYEEGRAESRGSSHSQDMMEPRASPMRYRTPDPEPSPSPTQAAADQVLQSMNDVSPSPSKRSKPRHTLSLADRTRLSMAPRGSSLFLEEEELDNDPTITNPTTVNTSADKTRVTSDGGPSDLVSRTRLSMAGFEKAQQKAHIERRRSQRRSRLPPQRKEGSYFPKVDEDQTMLAEDLMAEEDMEAVFRSRPKIKASPLPSPTREDFEDGFDY